ncbi:MAG: PilZ domain-containing protein [Lachnospiraceae bacterium]|nr:PilZ domain-containing protein [Lachnospiraceae bacterium]
MKLREIRPDFEISINVKSGNSRGNFVTTPAFSEDDNLYVHPFMHERYMIAFDGDLKIDMTAYTPGELPYYWRAVSISKAERRGRIYHVISSKIDGAKVNRRSAVRLPVGTKGVVTLQKGGLEHRVEIHNISATGISFIAREGDAPEFKRESRVRAMYTDVETGYNVDVFCRIVRVSKYNNKMVYGCSFTRVYMEIAKYLANKRIRGK